MSDDTGVFRLLQKHLDQQAVGFPAAESGADVRLLKKVFSPDEAALALQLSYRPTSLAQIVERGGPGSSAERVRGLLDSMFMKGAIAWRERGGIDQWHLHPLLIGMFEAAQDGVPAPGFLTGMGAYLETGEFVKAFVASRPSQVRVVPVNKSIKVEHHVATYDDLRAVIAAAPGPFAVLKCLCREMKSAGGHPCTKTTRQETCLALNDVAAATLRRAHGREMTREEMLSLLQQSEDDGLVLQPSNAQQPDFVCACCGCCCGLLAIQKMVPSPADFWASSYQCAVDAEACSLCAECVPRCQVGALTMAAAGGAAQIDLGRCIGCGLCVPACPTDALQLKRKESATVPPRDPEALYEEIKANRTRSNPGGASM